MVRREGPQDFSRRQAAPRVQYSGRDGNDKRRVRSEREGTVRVRRKGRERSKGTREHRQDSEHSLATDAQVRFQPKADIALGRNAVAFGWINPLHGFILIWPVAAPDRNLGGEVGARPLVFCADLLVRYCRHGLSDTLQNRLSLLRIENLTINA